MVVEDGFLVLGDPVLRQVGWKIAFQTVYTH
jgi:hypothetical protein